MFFPVITGHSVDILYIFKCCKMQDLFVLIYNEQKHHSMTYSSLNSLWCFCGACCATCNLIVFFFYTGGVTCAEL